MLAKILICVLFLLSITFGSAYITREILKHKCAYSIEGKLAETNYTGDYVKYGEDWYFLSDEEKKKLFNEAKVNDCWSSEVPMEKKSKGLPKSDERKPSKIPVKGFNAKTQRHFSGKMLVG